MEFLMTYGWAILVVLVIVGILFFSGNITDPTRFMKEECEFYITVVCLDHLVEKDEITLSVKNEAEREIIVENIIATSDALDGQCELTGVHRGKHLKNGEDFLFDLNITNAATMGLDPPENVGISWNLPDNEILLARAQSDSQGTNEQARTLYTLLKDTTTVPSGGHEDAKDNFNILIDNLSPDSASLFRRELPSPNNENLMPYKTRVINLLYKILYNATNKSRAAFEISTQTNLSNGSVTKDYLWNAIRDESDALFNYSYGGYDDYPLGLYIERNLDHVTEDYNRLSCEQFLTDGVLKHLNQVRQSRLNYATYETFISAAAANNDPALNREDLYDNFSESIRKIREFYESFIPAEVAGVNTMAPIISDAFKIPPEISDGNRSNLHRNGNFCNDGFDLTELELSNRERSYEILFQSTSGFQGDETIEYLNEDDFSLDAYCVLSVLVTDITTVDDGGSGGSRDNFNNDGTVDDEDENFDLFNYALSIDRLTKVNKAVDDVAADRTTPGDYKHSQNFNGADLDIIIKIIGSQDRIIESIRNDANIDRHNVDYDYIIRVISSVDNLDSDSVYCADYPDFSWIRRSFNNENLLIFYLNELYDPDDPGSRLYTRLYDEEEADPDIFVSFNSDLYYELLYEALIYDAARAVYNAGSRSDKANEIKEGINQAGNLFVFGIVTAPHFHVRNEYTACYDVSKLFNPNSGDLNDYVSHCSADYIRHHFYSFSYQDVVDSGLGSDDLVNFFQDTGAFYQQRIQEIRNFVFDSFDNFEQTIGLLLPTPMTVCQAAEDVSKDLNSIDISDRDRIDIILVNTNVPEPFRTDVSRILSSANVDASDRVDVSRILSNAGINESVKAAILGFLNDNTLDESEMVNIETLLDDADMSVLDEIIIVLDRAKVDESVGVNILLALDDPAVDESVKADILSVLEPYLARSNATADLFVDFDASISGAPLFDTITGDLKCELLEPPGSPALVTLFDLIKYVAEAASDIIMRADKDITAVPLLIIEINNWGLSSPPEIIDFSVTGPVTSSGFDVNVVVEDKGADLATFQIRALNAENPSQQKLLKLYDIRTDSPFTDSGACSTDQTRKQSCTVTITISDADFPRSAQDSGQDLVINLVATVTDDLNDRDKDSIRIEISSTPPPVVESFEIISMEHIHLDPGEYYTQVVVEVNATQRGGGDVDNITLSLPSEINGLNWDLNTQGMRQTDFENDLKANVSFFNYDQLPSVTRPNALAPPDWNCGSVSLIDGVTTCTKQFTITVSGKLNNNVIWLTAKAGSTNGVSGDFNKKLRIPAESIPACQYLDIGKSKNRYDLKLIYAWAESPGIFHTVTGTMLANSPE